jgi:hypothetical protein
MNNETAPLLSGSKELDVLTTTNEESSSPQTDVSTTTNETSDSQKTVVSITNETSGSPQSVESTDKPSSSQKPYNNYLENTLNAKRDDTYEKGTFKNIVANNTLSLTMPVYSLIAADPVLGVLNTSVQIISGLNSIPILNVFASLLIFSSYMYIAADARNDLFILMNDTYRICRNFIKILYFIDGLYNELLNLKIDDIVDKKNQDTVIDIIYDLLNILLESELMKRVTFLLKYLYGFSVHFTSIKHDGKKHSLFKRGLHRFSKHFWKGFNRMASFFNSPVYIRKINNGLTGLTGDMLIVITKFNLIFFKLQMLNSEPSIHKIINEILNNELFKNLFKNEITGINEYEHNKNEGEYTEYKKLKEEYNIKLKKYNSSDNSNSNLKSEIDTMNDKLKKHRFNTEKEYMTQDIVKMINKIRQVNNIDEEITEDNLKLNIFEKDILSEKGSKVGEKVINDIENETFNPIHPQTHKHPPIKMGGYTRKKNKNIKIKFKRRLFSRIKH